MHGMRRRELITLFGGAAAAWPVAARAQHAAMPVIGFLQPIVRGLRGAAARISPGPEGDGYVEGENVAVEYRWAENQPTAAGTGSGTGSPAGHRDRRAGTPAALAVKAATTTIPIVFAVAEDPVGSGSSPASLGRAET